MKNQQMMVDEIDKLKIEVASLKKQVKKNTPKRHGGLDCDYCGNLHAHCKVCGGEGTPWLI